VNEIMIYDTVIPAAASTETFITALDAVDTAVFTSPSGIRHAMALLGDDPGRLLSKRLVAIGPVTAEAMDNHGLKAAVTASEYTDEGIIRALTGEAP
jgi:uroporphyrinogen-III synthase